MEPWSHSPVTHAGVKKNDIQDHYSMLEEKKKKKKKKHSAFCYG